MKGESNQASLKVQPLGSGVLRLSLSGDWIARHGLPGIGVVEEAISQKDGGIVSAMEFESSGLARWNSGLIAFVVKCHEICGRHKIEFQSQTLVFILLI
jgi:hypothetical protein